MILDKESPSLWLQKVSKLNFFLKTHIICWRRIIAEYYLENNLLGEDHRHHVKDNVWGSGILIY